MFPLFKYIIESVDVLCPLTKVSDVFLAYLTGSRRAYPRLTLIQLTIKYFCYGKNQMCWYTYLRR